MQYTAKQEDAACNGDCLDCTAFILRRYDMCSPESSSYYLDVYETIWERQRRDPESAADPKRP
jgi:hypothetical protein